MTKSNFKRGEIVSFGTRKDKKFARFIKQERTTCHLFTFDRHQEKKHVTKIKRDNPSVLILESNLSGGKEALRSDKQRRQGIFFEELFRSFDFEVLRAKVHTVRALEKFMKIARKPEVLYVHYCGHGDIGEHKDPDEHKHTILSLSADSIYKPVKSMERIEKKLAMKLKANEKKQFEEDKKQYKILEDIFSNLDGKILMFSSCMIGYKDGLAQYISEISNAKAVIAYNEEVYDGQANVAETLLYWLLMGETKRKNVGKLVNELRENFKDWDPLGLPIVCYKNGKKYPKK